MQSYSHEQILNFAVKAGELMLKSGAETYRVEDTITRILKTHGYRFVDTFVIPTGIIVTIDDPEFSIYTRVCRIKNRSIRLDRIELINQLSRDYVLKNITFEEASIELKKIEKMSTYPPVLTITSLGISSAFFCIMFKGTSLDFMIALILGIIVGCIHYHLNQKHIISYFVLFICSLFIGFGTISMYFILENKIHIESIITGCITPLLPGVAFTNAVRDAIGDELLSGISRGVEAFLIAVCLAAGIGISLSTGFKLGGFL